MFIDKLVECLEQTFFLQENADDGSNKNETTNSSGPTETTTTTTISTAPTLDKLCSNQRLFVSLINLLTSMKYIVLIGNCFLPDGTIRFLRPLSREETESDPVIVRKLLIECATSKYNVHGGFF